MEQEIERHLRDYLLTFADVVTALGTRIYPNHAPQKVTVYPYAVYHRVSSVRWRTLADGARQGSPRIQFDCYGDTYAKASSAREVIANVADNFTAQVSTGSGGVCLLDLRVEDERDDYEEPVHADEIGEHVCSIDLVVAYRK